MNLMNQQIQEYLEACLSSLQLWMKICKTEQSRCTAIQYKMICYQVVYKNLILNEINETSFVTVLADDTTDFSESVQTVIVFRYLVKYKTKERFWGFFLPENQKASGISGCIL